MNNRFQVLFNSFKNEKDRDYIEEAIRIQVEAEKEGLRLRLLGALAFRYQCPREFLSFRGAGTQNYRY